MRSAQGGIAINRLPPARADTEGLWTQGARFPGAAFKTRVGNRGAFVRSVQERQQEEGESSEGGQVADYGSSRQRLGRGAIPPMDATKCSNRWR